MGRADVTDPEVPGELSTMGASQETPFVVDRIISICGVVPPTKFEYVTYT
jgi:hypothetical protein